MGAGNQGAKNKMNEACHYVCTGGGITRFPSVITIIILITTQQNGSAFSDAHAQTVIELKTGGKKSTEKTPPHHERC